MRRLIVAFFLLSISIFSQELKMDNLDKTNSIFYLGDFDLENSKELKNVINLIPKKDEFNGIDILEYIDKSRVIVYKHKSFGEDKFLIISKLNGESFFYNIKMNKGLLFKDTDIFYKQDDKEQFFIGNNKEFLVFSNDINLFFDVNEQIYEKGINYIFNLGKSEDYKYYYRSFSKTGSLIQGKKVNYTIDLIDNKGKKSTLYKISDYIEDSYDKTIDIGSYKLENTNKITINNNPSGLVDGFNLIFPLFKELDSNKKFNINSVINMEHDLGNYMLIEFAGNSVNEKELKDFFNSMFFYKNQSIIEKDFGYELPITGDKIFKLVINNKAIITDKKEIIEEIKKLETQPEYINLNEKIIIDYNNREKRELKINNKFFIESYEKF